jgi:hypothetical protein
MLGEIQTNRGNLHGGRLPCEWTSTTATIGTPMPEAGAVHPIKLSKTA